MAAIYLTEADVSGLLTMKMAVEAIEDCFRRLAAGEDEWCPRDLHGVRRRWRLVLQHEAQRPGGTPAARALLHQQPHRA